MRVRLHSYGTWWFNYVALICSPHSRPGLRWGVKGNIRVLSDDTIWTLLLYEVETERKRERERESQRERERESEWVSEWEEERFVCWIVYLGEISLPCCMKAPKANQRLFLTEKWLVSKCLDGSTLAAIGAECVSSSDHSAAPKRLTTNRTMLTPK